MLSSVTSGFAAWVFDTPRWKYLAVIFGVMLAKTGVTFVAPSTVAMAVDPYTNPFSHPSEHYQFWSWLGPWLAHQLGATTEVTFTLMYLGFALAFTVLVVGWLLRSLDDATARVAVLVFALLPVSAAPYYWVFTDALTLFLMACALYVPRNPLLLIALGTALGMHHFEQGVIATGAATFALAWTARRGTQLAYTWRWSLALLVGVVIGKVLLVALFARWGIEVNSGRLWYLASQWGHLVRRFAYSWHFVVFSMFAVGWLVVIPFIRRNRAESHPFGVAVLGLFLLLPISDDPTRVYAIVTFPLCCVFLLRNPEFLATLGRELVGLLVLLGLLVPWMFVWHGRPLVTALPYNVMKAVYEASPGPVDGPMSRPGPRDPRWF